MTEDAKKAAEDKSQSKKKTKKSSAKKTAKKIDPAAAQAKAAEVQVRSILDSAGRLADRIDAKFLYLIVESPSEFKVPESIMKRKNFVMAIAQKMVDDEVKKQFKNLLPIPNLQLSRMGKIKMAVMKSLAALMLEQGDKIVCVTGSRGLNTLDTMVVLDIGKEFELLSSAEIGKLSTQVRTEVFEELVSLSTELANQGREGKSVGAIFVLGDTDKVMDLSRQMIFNPFHGYPEEERNILDPRLRDTIKEFSAIDGAFIIRDDGVIMSAGRHLNATLEDESLPQGLGARHAAAAGITDVTNATAIAISESTGTVRIFKSGRIFMEIEKAPSPGRK